MQQPRRRIGHLLAGAAVIAATGLVVPATAAAAPATAGTADAAGNYLVVFKGATAPAGAASTVTRAGGTVVASYPQIGVLVARAADAGFGGRIRGDSSVDSASPTAGFASKVPDVEPAAADAQPGDLPNAPASDSDSLSTFQWDMRQMQVPQAHAITGGSRSVLVGDIDSGVDPQHPDLVPNLSDADSASCATGVAVPGLQAARDDNGHGTHTAGTIAAAANGHGIVGVAPNVRIAAVKASTPDGFFYPENVVCSFMWAAQRHMDVTNNSYFADPFLFNCRNDAVQRAVWKAEQRAIRYAMDQGVTVVAAEGNESEDLSHPSVDATSPDDAPKPVTRDVTNACVVIPTEIPGVIGVTSTGSLTQGTTAGAFADHLKAYYSSFGTSSADVAAPGGDFYFRGSDPGAVVNGEVLSTWPSYEPCSSSIKESTGDVTYPTATYCWLQGTSMASPHVTGLAALVISRFGDASTPQNGKMRPSQVEQYVEQTADPQVCPTTLPTTTIGRLAGTNYGQITGSQSGTPQRCTGGAGHTSWYGNGEANALAAVTHDTSNH